MSPISRSARCCTLLAISLLLAACSGSDATQPAGTDAGTGDTATPGTDTTPDATEAPLPADAKAWTVLVYSIADTDLEPYMMVDVEEMGTVGTTDNMNMVALVDRAADFSSDDVLGVPNWEGGKLLQIGQGTAEVLADYGDIDTGDPQVLTDFIANGIAANPAQHYALIISDHGASWPGVGGDISADEDGLSLGELSDAITAGLTEASVDHLDLLGFDACLMSTYEVATQLSPLANRMVASQELEPGHGWDYGAFSVLDDPAAADVDALGNALLDGYQQQAVTEETDSDITLSLLDLTKVPALNEAVDGFAGAVIEQAPATAPVIGRVRAKTIGFGRSSDPTQDTQMTDLGQLVQQVGAGAPAVADQAAAVNDAIADVVVREVDGRATAKATGLSVYFPPNAALLDPEYANAVHDSAWSTMLAAYYSAGKEVTANTAPQFVTTDGVADASFDGDGLTLTGTLQPGTADKIADVTISYGTVGADGSITYLGEEDGEITDEAAGIVTGVYDLTSFTISDGQETATAYLELTFDDDGTATIDVPMAYYAPENIGSDTYQDVVLSITLDAETFDVLSETYYTYNETLGTYGELTADPTGIVVPKLFVVSPDGVGDWQPSTDVGLSADLPSLVYDFVPLASGTALVADLSVTDIGSNSAVVSADVVVP